MSDIYSDIESYTKISSICSLRNYNCRILLLHFKDREGLGVLCLLGELLLLISCEVLHDFNLYTEIWSGKISSSLRDGHNAMLGSDTTTGSGGITGSDLSLCIQFLITSSDDN